VLEAEEMMMNNSCPLADPMDRGMDMPGMKVSHETHHLLLLYTSDVLPF
jgi:hypothetical protein